VALLVAALAQGGLSSAQASARAIEAAHQDTAAVERRLLEAVRDNPDSFEAHHVLASFYLQHGKVQAAIPHLERARTLEPTHYVNLADPSMSSRLPDNSRK
jgi:Tfp pilus assembly protein PilF